MWHRKNKVRNALLPKRRVGAFHPCSKNLGIGLHVCTGSSPVSKSVDFFVLNARKELQQQQLKWCSHFVQLHKIRTLKDKFTQKWEFNHYLLNLLLMESQAKFPQVNGILKSGKTLQWRSQLRLFVFYILRQLPDFTQLSNLRLFVDILLFLGVGQFLQQMFFFFPFFFFFFFFRRSSLVITTKIFWGGK